MLTGRHFWYLNIYSKKMAENKKQHFVPKLLLRHFSNDTEKKLINIFNSDTKFYRADCPLKDQGQEDYFYGEDGQIEEALAKLENAAAPIISDIITKGNLPKRESEEYQHLFFFSFLLSYRTKYVVEQMNEVVDKTFQEIAKLDVRFDKFKESGIRMELNNPAALSLGIVSKGIWQAYDLELVWLINKSTSKFFTSDNPSIRYNQFLESRKHPGGHLGMFTKGLQLFFPISPDFMLVYYDKWAYKFGNKKDKVIFVTNPADIDQLNYLQVINCTEIIYSNNSIKEFALSQLSDRAKALRSRDKTKLYEINKRFKDKEGNEHIQYTQHGDNRTTRLNLSFVKQPQGAKSHKINDFVVQLRDERLRHIKK